MINLSTGKPYDVGLVCGRFQLFHAGHELLINTALNICDRVLVFIGSAQEFSTEKNPFSISTRLKLLNEVYAGNPRVLIHALPDLNAELSDDYCWGKYLLESANMYLYKNPDIMVYGNDKPYSKWFDEKDLKDTSILVLNRTGSINISATVLRDYMVSDYRKEWMHYTNPRLHKFYPELREELLSVGYYKDKLIEKQTKGNIYEQSNNR